MKYTAAQIRKAREFICWNRFDGITMLGNRHRFEVGDKVVHRYGMMFLRDEPLMLIKSINFPITFAYNGDNRGIERGHIVHKIHRAVHDLEGVSFPEVKRDLFVRKWGYFLDGFMQLLPSTHLMPFDVIAEMAEDLGIPKEPPLNLDAYKFLFEKAA